jgi:hypothetical protein
MNIDHIDLSLAKIRAIFEKASARIEALPPGGKIPATTLADILAKEIGMTGPQLYPTLKFLIDGYPGVKVKKGAQGGIEKQPLAKAAVDGDDIVTEVAGLQQQ